MTFELEKGIPIIERAKEITNYEDFLNIDTWLSSETYSADTIQLNSRIGRKPTSVAYLQRLAVNYWHTNNDAELKKLTQELNEIFEKKIKYEALQDYYYDTLTAILTKGSALRKNDLLDALILCNIQAEHTLITYDSGVIERMKRRSNKYPQYKKSVEIINELKVVKD